MLYSCIRPQPAGHFLSRPDAWRTTSLWHLPEEQFQLLGLTCRWPDGLCRAAMCRSTAVQRKIMMKGSLPNWRTDTASTHPLIFGVPMAGTVNTAIAQAVEPLGICFTLAGYKNGLSVQENRTPNNAGLNCRCRQSTASNYLSPKAMVICVVQPQPKVLSQMPSKLRRHDSESLRRHFPP